MMLSLSGVNNALASYGYDVATSTALSMSNGSAAGYGPWYELTSSLANDCDVAVISSFSGNANLLTYQIGIGPAGSEVVIAQGHTVSFIELNESCTVWIKAHIEKGNRVCIRSASPGAWTTSNVTVTLLNTNGMPALRVVDSNLIAAGTDTAPHISLVGPTADNTWSAWSEITASAADDADTILLTLYTSDKVGGEGDEYLLVEFGVGAAGAEQATGIITGFYARSYVAGALLRYGLLPVRVRKGQRLAARFQSSNISARSVIPYNFDKSGFTLFKRTF